MVWGPRDYCALPFGCTIAEADVRPTFMVTGVPGLAFRASALTVLARRGSRGIPAFVSRHSTAVVLGLALESCLPYKFHKTDAEIVAEIEGEYSRIAALQLPLSFVSRPNACRVLNVLDSRHAPRAYRRLSARLHPAFNGPRAQRFSVLVEFMAMQAQASLSRARHLLVHGRDHAPTAGSFSLSAAATVLAAVRYARAKSDGIAADHQDRRMPPDAQASRARTVQGKTENSKLLATQ